MRKNTQLWLEAYNVTREKLLSIQDYPFWRGQLSDSALATAVAIIALCAFDKQKYAAQINRGMEWIKNDRNQDSGWGDCPDSPSNPTCTTLVAAAKQIAEERSPLAAINYVDQFGGIESTISRYGKDKTFSVPIMAACAISGLCRWEKVPPLPMELAALPRWTYRLGPMPVVSYALPALIAIGLAVNENNPNINTAVYKLRNSLRPKLLNIIENIQPVSGGFLEATPLTGFVAMCLCAAGENNSPVTRRCLDFLSGAQRENGSWAIDENLSCWNTSQAIIALGKVDQDCTDWLASCQSTHINAFTNSAPGGWPWTDLTGGVPDADDTAAAILALRANNSGKRYDSFISNGAKWLLNLQNSDGGWPTFCRGWGKLPFDKSCCDITAHALRALLAVSNMAGMPVKKINKAFKRGMKFLRKNQQKNGSFYPLWFGSQFREDKTNPTIGTARVLRLYNALSGVESTEAVAASEYLLESVNSDGGWGAAPDCPTTIEETALAVAALAPRKMLNDSSAVCEALDYLSRAALDDKLDTPAPVGLYFSQLWYSEKLYPVTWTLEALKIAISMKNLI